MDARTGYLSTPLHYGSHWGHWRAVELLVRAGADVDAQNEVGWTALHHATFTADPACCEVLMAAGADPGVQNSDGDTAWDFARRKGRGGHTAVMSRYGGKHPVKIVPGGGYPGLEVEEDEESGVDTS